MSDFGALIELKTISQTKLTAEEIRLFRNAVDKIKKENQFSDALGESFLFKIMDVDSNGSSLVVILSEYWFGDEDEQETFDFAKENDLEKIETIAASLQALMGKEHIVTAIFDGW
ncbi:MAG: hypothetical protein FD123_2248 [Bacteroidetes bacterium]|nr:MAG: hypothetical protein FD123_2248 [Bacteroidota bacterium]